MQGSDVGRLLSFNEILESHSVDVGNSSHLYIPLLALFMPSCQESDMENGGHSHINQWDSFVNQMT